jgi:hypothetical protein
VSAGTVQRAVELVKRWGLVEVNPRRRNIVRRPLGPQADGDGVSTDPVKPAAQLTSVPSNPEPLDLEIRKLGQVVSTVRTVADLTDHNVLGRLLGAAVRRNGDATSEIGDYDMVVHRAGDRDAVMIFVAAVP